MGLLIKHNRAKHTHENEQFRRVASALKLLFDQKNWDGILIGNPYNDQYPNFRADALLFYNYGLIIIDFKAYSGTLKLPANKNEFEIAQWYIKPEDSNEKIPVRAGKNFINPFIQLNSYRKAFKQIIQSEFQLNDCIDENKICILNIFSGTLIIENSIPKEFPFYKIIQESELGTFLYDYSSNNTYSKEAADILCKIFDASDWEEHILLPEAKPFVDRIIHIEENVKNAISEFLKTDEGGILVLESISTDERDSWVNYILSVSLNFNIPQIETWVHSRRVARKVSLRLGIEFQSLYNTIYGGSPRMQDEENTEQEEQPNEEYLYEIIPIRDDSLLNHKALIILHEAHLVSRSFHQSEVLQFGTGRLLEDLINFLQIDKTQRKLICIGDPYSLTYGKDTDSAMNLQTLAKLYKGKISHYKQKISNVNNEGKEGLKHNLVYGIENKLFNNLKYKWKSDDLLEISKEAIPELLKSWFSTIMSSEPHNIVMVFSNKDAKKINHWIKLNCIKNGQDLAKNDLLFVNNNVNIANETGFEKPAKLYNGMFLLVEDILKSETKFIQIKQSHTPIPLNFTKVKAKCLSLHNKPTLEIWILNNYLHGDGILSKEEHIAFKVYINKQVSEKIKEQPFINSSDHKQMIQDAEYKKLLEEKEKFNELNEKGEKVKTKLDKIEKEIRKIEKKYNKQFKTKILSSILQTDPFVNAVHALYGWALTVHKCIGYTFTNAIINANQGDNRGITNSDYYRWLYSAISTVTNVLYVVNPIVIHPLMHTHFEDTTANYQYSSTNKKKLSLTFKNYKVEEEFLDKIPNSLNENVKGTICELAKLLKQIGYSLISVVPNNEYLTKTFFSIPSIANKYLIIVINNKGAKDNWSVSSVRIEKNETENETKIKECIEALFQITHENKDGNLIPYPTDFRGEIYSKWSTILKEKGFRLELIESHQYQDIFNIMSDNSVAKFKIWYRDDGFISKFVILEKSEENLGAKLKKWLIDENY